MQEVIKDTIKDIKEVVKDRFFSPMYFYFIISWVITNWSFVYVLLFSDEESILSSRHILKIEYLRTFYNFDNWSHFFISLSELFFIPALSAFVFSWWISKLSEIFYEKYEQHKINKQVILRRLTYTAQAQLANEQRKIRDAESDKNKIQYVDNDFYNNDIDERNSDIEVDGIVMRPSEVLYNTDYEAYRTGLEEVIDRAGDQYLQSYEASMRGK